MLKYTNVIRTSTQLVHVREAVTEWLRQRNGARNTRTLKAPGYRMRQVGTASGRYIGYI